MRIITIHRGAFKGEHKIYESLKDAKGDNIVVKGPWHDASVVVGDWVIADDGYICQCLSRFKLVNKRHRRGQYTDCYRYPQGTWGIYVDALGKRHISKYFYGMVTNNNRSALGNTPALGRYMPIRKKEFVMWMSMGIDPFTSYVKAFKPYNKNINSITIQINKLLSDPLVKEELMEVMKGFIDDVQKEIKEISEYTDLWQLLVKRTAKLLVKPRSNDIAELSILKFAFEQLGQQIGVVLPDSKSNKKEIQDASFEVMVPPELGAAA